MRGKTIQIYLPDGDPKSVKIASITTDKIEVIQIPRTILAENKNVLDFNGIYILVDSLKTDKPEIYIGKGNVKSRVSQHDKNKEFWNVIFAVKLNDNSGFNDAHNSYLEHYFVKKAADIDMSIMRENKQTPKCPKLSDSIASDLEYYIATLETLFSSLGLKCFQPKETQSKLIFTCKDKHGNIGRGEYTEDGFMLYKDAICSLTLHRGTKSMPFRDNLINSSVLKESEGHYILQTNIVFPSVSSASSVILGRSSNGWTEWKDDQGKSLDELKSR